MGKKNDEPGNPGVKVIIEKYIALRDDIADPIKQVLKTLYRGETHTVSDWEGIVKRRLERPA